MKNKIKYVPKRAGIGAIRLYQKHLSPLLGNTCRFYPTCSDYTQQAIDKYGIIKGSLKGVLRIIRCNPFNKGGIDSLK